MGDGHNQCFDGIWLVKDVLGIICAIFTWSLIIFAEYVVMTCILLPEEDTIYKIFNICIFQLLAFLAVSSHIKTMFTDPGAVPRGTATKEAIESLGMLVCSPSLSSLIILILIFIIAILILFLFFHFFFVFFYRLKWRSSSVQMPKVLQYQTWKNSSLLSLSTMYSKNGSSLSMGQQLHRT